MKVKMDHLEYFRSITLELEALKDRVRHFIRDQHWLSDGEWKESVLRAMLRRHLPLNIGVGRGFVITEDGPSTQIDILLYDRTKPLLYQDGDLVLITPDVCLGIVEVKTRSTKLRDALVTLAECRQRISRCAHCCQFSGLFSFEYGRGGHTPLLRHLQSSAFGKDGSDQHHRLADCVSLGGSLFARHYRCAPEAPRTPKAIFRAYNLHDVAPAHFIHNVIEVLCEPSVLPHKHVWCPPRDIEEYRLGEIPLKPKVA